MNIFNGHNKDAPSNKDVTKEVNVFLNLVLYSIHDVDKRNTTADDIRSWSCRYSVKT
jgi:hypothetical protein